LVQWWASEQKGYSVIPLAFWWLSLMGGVALLGYAISRHDPVIVTGQAMGLFVYARNLMLTHKRKSASVKTTSMRFTPAEIGAPPGCNSLNRGAIDVNHDPRVASSG
jgi:hypothetical protein